MLSTKCTKIAVNLRRKIPCFDGREKYAEKNGKRNEGRRREERI